MFEGHMQMKRQCRQERAIEGKSPKVEFDYKRTERNIRKKPKENRKKAMRQVSEE
jgi:hypothetical protein